MGLKAWLSVGRGVDLVGQTAALLFGESLNPASEAGYVRHCMDKNRQKNIVNKNVSGELNETL
ncbi:hypothetical protein ACLM44_02370 [Synechococcus sp. W2B2]|uniref:hypothetical protein n=1 Tax=unclassified Synechococcus TaxID=2626047 RepID=UPI001E5EE782|nr:hypothetical protein [Synechococcus sp. WH 7805]